MQMFNVWGNDCFLTVCDFIDIGYKLGVLNDNQETKVMFSIKSQCKTYSCHIQDI